MKRKYMKNPTIFKVPVTATMTINLEVVASTIEDAKNLIDGYIEDDFSNIKLDDFNPYLKNGYHVLKNEIVGISHKSIERKE